MSFEYKGFKVERYDTNNINLYQWKTVKRINKKTKVETLTDEWVALGYFVTFFGAARRLIDHLCEDARNIHELREIIREWSFIQKELDK